VQPALVAVEHHQGRRAEPADLAAQLGADRPTRPGDEHSLAGELVGDRPHVEVDRLAAQQVCDVEGTQVRCRRTAAEQLADRGEDEHLETRAARPGGQVSHRLGRRAGHGDDEGRRVVARRDLGKVRSGTAHSHAV
jgi:hypothetical protein